MWPFKKKQIVKPALLPEQLALVENLKDRLLIALVKKLGKKAWISVKKLEGLEQEVLQLAIKDGKIIFRIQKKN